jgi:hypothetical protein
MGPVENDSILDDMRRTGSRVCRERGKLQLRQLAPDDICLNSAPREKIKDSDTNTGVQSIRVGEMVVRRAARGWFWSSASKSDSSNKEQ